MTAATPHIAAFLTSGKIKCLEFIYPSTHKALLVSERLVSCILINYIRQILPPKETVSTLSRSANISWLFIQLHLTNCCFARNIWDHLLLQPEMGGLIWHINLGFVAPRLWPMGRRFFHLSFKLLITHHWILKGIVLSPLYTSCTLNALLPGPFHH